MGTRFNRSQQQAAGSRCSRGAVLGLAANGGTARPEGPALSARDGLPGSRLLGGDPVFGIGVTGLGEAPGGLPQVPPLWALLAHAPVDALAQQVGVPVMAGVLLDHVHEKLAQRDRRTLGVAAGEA